MAALVRRGWGFCLARVFWLHSETTRLRNPSSSGRRVGSRIFDPFAPERALAFGRQRADRLSRSMLRSPNLHQSSRQYRASDCTVRRVGEHTGDESLVTVFNYTAGKSTADGESLELDMSRLAGLGSGKLKLSDAIQQKKARVVGDQKKTEDLLGLFSSFDFWFPIVTP